MGVWLMLTKFTEVFNKPHVMCWELKSRPDEIGLLSTPNMCCGLVKGKVILHPALLFAVVVDFVLFDLILYVSSTIFQL